MVALDRGPFPREQVEVHSVARDDDALLLRGEMHERPVGETRKPHIRRDREHVVPELAKRLADPGGRKVSVEEQLHSAVSSS